MPVLRSRWAAGSEMNGQRVDSGKHDDIASRDTMLAGGALVDADLADIAIRFGDTGMDRCARNAGNDMRGEALIVESNIDRLGCLLAAGRQYSRTRQNEIVGRIRCVADEAQLIEAVRQQRRLGCVIESVEHEQRVKVVPDHRATKAWYSRV